MASIDGHRVLIASLFLPNTVDLSPHGSPVATPITTPASPKLIPDVKPTIIPPSVALPAVKKKLKSIIEDLAVKTPQATPANEPSNPFASVFPSVVKAPGMVRTISHSRVPSIPGNAFSDAITTPLSRAASTPASGVLPSTPVPSITPITTAVDNDVDADGDARRSRADLAQSPLQSPSAPTAVDDSVPARTSSPGVGRRQSRSSRSGVRRSNSLLSMSDGRRSVLPWEMTRSMHGNPGLHKAVASVVDKVPDVKWIGILDTPTDSIAEDTRKDMDAKLGLVDNIPVWVHDADFHAAYDVFCHQVLWPTLHYAVPDAPKTNVVYESSSFVQYKRVNEQFADAIVANYKEGDIVWINDYHLCLVPALVRKKLPDAPIGFFMHVAWPSTEIFRCLAVREQLLYGLLGSDLLGFQTHNYARHFRQTCSRILSLEALPKGIQLEHSFVDVAVFPIGIDVQDLTQKRQEPEVGEWAKNIRQRYEGKKLIVGRDKLDEVSGVRHKVAAFEHFLERYPEFQGQVVLIQVALATTEQNELQASITDVVSHVNSRFGSLTYQPVVLLHTQDITFPMYLGLLTAADAFIVTSLREGMALRTHEFVECQHERKRPLILSEFTGSYSYSGFRSCIAINPWDYRNTAQAIHEALTMSDDEATTRWEDLHSHVITQTAQSFVTAFLTRCIRVHAEHVRRNPLSIPILPLSPSDLPIDPAPHVERSTDADAEAEPEPAAPTGHTLSAVEKSTHKEGILQRYAGSKKVLLLLDFESTLWTEDPRVTREHGFVPPERVVRVLQGLVATKNADGEKKNQVWLLSGLPVRKLEKIAELVPGLGLVAENGCFIQDPESKEWRSTVSRINFDWKPICLEILAYFTERTPGSFVEDREASVVWRFLAGLNEKDDQEKAWAKRQAAEAQNHIWDSLGERFALRIIPGATSFLVLPKNVSRSTAVGAILKHDNAPSLLASVSAAAFWNPTGLIPRPSSPQHSHLHPRLQPTQGPTVAGTPNILEQDYQQRDLTSHGQNLIHSQHLNLHHPLAQLPGGTYLPNLPSIEDAIGANRAGAKCEYDMVLALTGDEPLIRRLNRLDEAQTCSTSGKGSDAMWRLPAAEALDALERFITV